MFFYNWIKLSHICHKILRDVVTKATTTKSALFQSLTKDSQTLENVSFKAFYGGESSVTDITVILQSVSNINHFML